MQHLHTLRFSASDKAAIVSALKAAVAKNDPSLPLVTIAARSIFCTLADLREAEVEWIWQQIEAIAVEAGDL